MEDGEHQKFAGAHGASVQARDAHLRLQHELCGELSKGDQHLRVDGARLLAQIRRAGLNLLGARVAVSRRAAFQDVRDVDVLASQPGQTQKLVEVLPRRAHERLPLRIFVTPRRLADEQHARMGVSHAEHRLRAAVGKRAATAGGNVFAQRVKGYMRLGHRRPPRPMVNVWGKTSTTPARLKPT